MRQPHQITVEGLQLWHSQEEALYASSTRERKRLTCTLDGTFMVTVAGRMVWYGREISLAVEAYNAITEKYNDETPTPFVL